MDLEKTRFNMIEQQIRPWDVLDQDILDLLFEVKREEFVPAAHKALALFDMEIPLTPAFRMWHPKLEARVVQDLHIKPTDRVLEIGTGSGYLTALLAKRGRHVYSVDINPELSAQAKTNLKKAGITNVTLDIGDGARGWSAHAPYDVIVITGSLPLPPLAQQQELADGGRLFAVIGEEPVMSGTLITREANGGFLSEVLFETVIAPLENAPEAEHFVF